MASVLFDPRSTFSYVSSSFATGLYLYCDLLDMPISVSTSVGEPVIVEKVYRLSCDFCGEQYSCRLDYPRNG